MAWNLDDVPLYVAVVEHNGVSSAANYLQISKSAVSKALARLEHDLGVRLLARNTRNLRITSEGQAFYRHCLLIMEQVSEANAVMAGLTNTPSGRLAIALPMAFGREIVAPQLGEFQRRYPLIDLELLITSHPVDIIREQIDLAVVIGSLNDSDLMVKKLYDSTLWCVTSPEYAEQNALGFTPDDLLKHIQLCEKRYVGKSFPIHIEGQKKTLTLNKKMISINDPIAVRSAVLNGFGIALVPDPYCRQHLATGELVRVFEHIEFEPSVSVISAIYPSRRLISNKTRAFLDFLIELCGRI